MLNGIKAAIQAGFTDIHIEGDNRILIQAVQKKKSSSMENSSTTLRYHCLFK